MNRIKQTFENTKVYAAYITAGDGDLETQLTMIRALIAGGVNLLEIGVPFSDPIADGPVIQRAMQRALNNGTSLHDVVKLIKALRAETEIPIILFTYYNPILKLQHNNILQKVKDAGADGVLVVDLPFFEAKKHLEICKQLSLAPIAVISPTTSADRIKELSSQGDGFLYYACRRGTTGMKTDLPNDIRDKVTQIKNLSSLPVIIGFGIADKASSTAAIELADGFVVGSYFVKAMESNISATDLTNCARNINPNLKGNS